MLVIRMDHENSLVTDNTCVHVRLCPFGFLRPPVFRTLSIYKRESNFIKPSFFALLWLLLLFVCSVARCKIVMPLNKIYLK